MWQKILYLGLAGASGALVRYWLSGIVQRHSIGGFPVGTAAVNVIGCLLFGIVWAFLETRLSVNSQIRTAVFVGFFGSFTTFSSFAFETAQLLDESQWLWASGNILFQNVLGLAAMVGGLAIGKWL